MDVDIPTDLITKSQTHFRQLAGLSSFENNTPPSLQSTFATSPSADSLKCNKCDGNLHSLVCIHCGNFNQNKDKTRDNLLFKSTTAYGWLLQSLNFNGSERVGSLAEGIGINGAQSPAEDEITVSELLDLQIVWRDEPQKSECNFNIRDTSELDSSLHLGRDDVDNFFIESKRATVSEVPEEQPVANRNDQNKDFNGQENLTLFQNVLPPEMSVTSSIDASDDASSGWNAEFQSADNTKLGNETSDSFDPFVGAETDLSSHMDSVFGQMEGFNDKKPNDDIDPLPSTAHDWIQDDLFGKTEGFSNKKPNDDSDSFPSTGKDWNEDDLFGQTEGFDNKKTNNNSDPFPSTGDDWIQGDLFANTSSATLKQAEQLDSVVQVHDVSPDLDTKDEEEDWFGDGNWQKSNTANTAVSQQVDQLDVVGKQNDGSLHNNVNDSSAEGVDVDWFESTNWQKSTANTAVSEQADKLDVVHQRNDGSSHIVIDSSTEDVDVDWFENTSWQSTANNTATAKVDNLFDTKPPIDSVSSSSLVNDLLKNDGSDRNNSKKQNLDATDWFQDSQWTIGASNSTTNMVASKDDDALDDWNDFTSSTVDQDSYPDPWKENSHNKVAKSEKMSELNLFPATADAQEVDFGNFLQSDLFSSSSSNKNPTNTQEVFDIFSEVSTTSRIPNAGAGNSSEGPKNDKVTQNPVASQKNDVQMLLSQMHDLSFMLKNELSIPSKPDDHDSSHS